MTFLTGNCVYERQMRFLYCFEGEILYSNARIRGNPYKIVVNQCRLNVRKNVSSERVAVAWNSLPPSVVNFTSCKQRIYNILLLYFATVSTMQHVAPTCCNCVAIYYNSSPFIRKKNASLCRTCYTLYTLPC